jgi:hypothetical protein
MFDVYVIESDPIMVGRPKGVLDANEAERIVEFIQVKESELEFGFNRFCDLSFVDRVNLSSVEVQKLADRRRVFNPNLVHVKSAFLAGNAFTLGLARMYEQLLNSPRIEVGVFTTLEDSAKWLSVSVGKLTL